MDKISLNIPTKNEMDQWRAMLVQDSFGHKEVKRALRRSLDEIDRLRALFNLQMEWLSDIAQATGVRKPEERMFSPGEVRIRVRQLVVDRDESIACAARLALDVVALLKKRDEAMEALRPLARGEASGVTWRRDVLCARKLLAEYEAERCKVCGGAATSATPCASCGRPY